MADFAYDVFLSHSSNNKPEARALAQKLKADGLNVWFDEWVIRPGMSIPDAIEDGLQNSKTLVLVMSDDAFDSDWVTLERQTARFRDPMNRDKRFIPLLLEDADIPDMLKHFVYIDYRSQAQAEYDKLLAACRCYDVYLCYAKPDVVAVRELAERLNGDGLRVWWDEWVIQPGDSIPLAIQQGLEISRTFVLVMSQAAFDSEWVTLERHTALFRDPTNQQKRFIPLRLDDCDIPESLKIFAYIEWSTRSDTEYANLLSTCQPIEANESSRLALVQDTPKKEFPRLEVELYQQVIIYTSPTQDPVFLRWDLPGMTKKCGAKTNANARHWKRIHTLSENAYQAFRDVHFQMDRYHQTGNDTCREFAGQLLEQAVRALDDFCEQVQSMPKSVREAEHIVIMLKMRDGVSALRRGLTFGDRTREFEYALYFADRVRAWCFECLQRADRFLEMYFASAGSTRK